MSDALVSQLNIYGEFDPGSGRTLAACLWAHAQPGARKGDAAKAARNVVGDVEGGRRKSAGGAGAGVTAGTEENGAEKDPAEEEEGDEDLDGLGDIWAEMYAAREEVELAEEEEGRG